MKKTVVPALILAAICLVVVALLVFTNEITKGRIAQAESEAKQAAVRSVLADAEISQIEDENGNIIYVGKTADGVIVGYAFEESVKGYGGNVTTVVGISVDGEILGVSVSAPDETPGLGANVAKDEFAHQFIGKTSGSYASDFEAVTSATYSSEAVKEGIRLAFEKFDALDTALGGEG